MEELNILELVIKYEENKIDIKELSEAEIELIKNYYKKECETLDKEILYKKFRLKKLSSELTKKYERAIKLKEAN